MLLRSQMYKFCGHTLIFYGLPYTGKIDILKRLVSQIKWAYKKEFLIKYTNINCVKIFHKCIKLFMVNFISLFSEINNLWENY